MRFSEAIDPVDVSVFCAEYLGRAWFKHGGSRDRFASLVPWSALNEVLSRVRLEPGSQRIKLVKDGEPVERRAYLAATDDRLGARLDTRAFHQCLRNGATLVFNSVDDEFDEVRELADTAQQLLKAQISVNLYAGWRRAKGFDLHWDTHDTLIFQIAGCKQWRVYEPTRRHPLEHDVEPAPPPRARPVWEGVLEQGETLYMPRGWWHVAHPLDEPSLHLTVGITSPKGDQFLKWLVDQLKIHDDIRADLPMFGEADVLMEHLRRLQELLALSLDALALHRFTDYVNARLSTRPRIDLPSQARLQPAETLTAESRVTLTPAGLAEFARPDAGRQILPALRLLTNGGNRSVAELCSAVEPSSKPLLKMSILDMCLHGWLVVEAPVPTASNRPFTGETRP